MSASRTREDPGNTSWRGFMPKPMPTIRALANGFHVSCPAWVACVGPGPYSPHLMRHARHWSPWHDGQCERAVVSRSRLKA